MVMLDNPANDVADYTTQIFQNDKPIGSGVFVEVDKRFYLLSAAHLFWENLDNSYSFSINGGEILEMTGLHSIMNENFNSTKDYDFSLLELREDLINKIILYNKFYNLEETSNSFPINTPVHVFGYLAKNTKKYHATIAYQFNCISRIISLKRNRQEEPSFLFAEYKRRKLHLNNNFDVFKTTPIPKGCSGCGFWNYVNGHAMLIGVFIEYDPKKSTLKAVRTNLVIDFIKRIKSA